MRGSNVFSPLLIRASAVVDLSPHAWATEREPEHARVHCGSGALTGAPRELQPFAKHANRAIFEEWMLEGKFNGYMT